MAKPPSTVKDYLASLPTDRRAAVEAIRKVIRANIDPAFKEGIQYGMVGYFLPHSVYPDGYHCDPKQPLPFASIASQKNHIGLYLFCIYGNTDEEARFREEWLAAGKRLDMGKACVRVKKLEDVPLDVVGRLFQRVTARKFVAQYEAALAGTAAGRKRAAKKKSAKKAARKTAKETARKPAAPRATKKKPVRKAAKKAARRAAR